MPPDPDHVCEKNGGVFKRLRKRPRREPIPEIYDLKVEGLRMLEELSEQGAIDLYYGDECRVSVQPCVPYAWQFKDEEVFMPSAKGPGLNSFAWLSRANDCRFETTTKSINADFIIEQVDGLSWQAWQRGRITVAVLDNAPAHIAKRVQECRKAWEERGLFLFYLPPYSPHLNIVEILWRHLKYYWLQAGDYLDTQRLFYQVRQALAAVGSLLHIHFKPFQYSLN